MTEGKRETFSHSIKVPRLYKVCSAILQQFQGKKGSLKTLVYAARKKHPNIKALMGLAASVLDNTSALEEMLSESQILIKEAPLQEHLAKVLIAELVWGKGSLPGESKPVQAVNKYKHVFAKHKQEGCPPNKRLVVPRWVRINSLKVNSNDWLHNSLKKEGFSFVEPSSHQMSYREFLDQVRSLGKGCYVHDYHLDGVLAFASGTEFHQSKLYKEGCLILQDKASCLTVAALKPQKGLSVLDACAAPGMKTSQAAAAVTPSGKVTAIERDLKRCSTLRKTVKKHTGPFVRVLNKDFLSLDPRDYPDVQAIVLDPSCSGSGIRDTGVTDLSQERLDKLAGMQAKLLAHALTFPSLKSLAYSTCSTQRTENEDVVMKVLSEHKQFRLRSGVLPTWTRRGDPTALTDPDLAEAFIRADPEQDLCHGFFVAVIEK